MGDSGNGLHLSGILLAVLVLAAWMLQSPPLAPSRPGHGDQLRDNGSGFEDVPARLWQDPFETVQRFRAQRAARRDDVRLTLPNGETVTLNMPAAESPDQGHQLAHLEAYINETVGADRAALTVLGVMALTSPYAEQAEHRLRLRSAAIAALTANGVAPQDGEHIGYWVTAAQAGEADAAIPTAVVPYELYQGNGRTVLLLWLPADHFGRHPVTRLASLVAALRDRVLRQPAGELAPGRLTIIGPPDSGTLQRMAAQAAAPDAAGPLQALRGVELFSATATAPACALLRPNDPGACPALPDDVRADPDEQALRQPLERLGLRFVRTIVTDRYIAKALVEELNKRGVDPACRDNARYPRQRCHEPGTDDRYLGYRDHVVLISEADTTFGRTLPRLFNAEVVKQLPASLAKQVGNGTLPWIHRFGYLRGVDGELPNTQTKTRTASPTSLEGLSELDYAVLEPAVGSSQFDYLRRLAAVIRDLDRDLHDRKLGRVRAIGVLGNDLYDKLLILQSMREHFPNHLFFSNDLDARLLDAKEYRWTRNLVVASSFGLQLHPDWQAFVPPSRGVYQTSVFLSTHLALRLADDQRTAAALTPQLAARVFEVGRGRFFDLGPVAAPGPVGMPLHDRQGYALAPFYPPAYRAPRLPPQWPWLVAMAALALVLLVLLISPVRTWLMRLFSERGVAGVAVPAGLGIVALAILRGAYLWMIDQEEPFAWAAGVSIWPSELIRLGCIMLSLLFLWLGARRLRHAERALEKDFGLGSCLSSPSSARSCSWTGLRRACAMFSWYDETGRTAAGGEPLAKVWQDYCSHARLPHRAARTVLLVLLLWTIAWIALVFVQPMQVPYRCTTSYTFSFWLGMGPLALSFGMLLFWVMDETRLCSALIRRICHSDQAWPNAGNLLDRDRLTVDFIARRTEPAGNMIWFPFVILILILISMSTRFDNYDTKTAVITLLGSAVAIALSSAYLLRRTARATKQRIVAALRQRMLANRKAEAKTEPDQIEVLIKQIEDIHQGAFRPWYQEPLVRALAWVGSMGAVIITEYLTVSG